MSVSSAEKWLEIIQVPDRFEWVSALFEAILFDHFSVRRTAVYAGMFRLVGIEDKISFPVPSDEKIADTIVQTFLHGLWTKPA